MLIIYVDQPKPVANVFPKHFHTSIQPMSMTFNTNQSTQIILQPRNVRATNIIVKHLLLKTST